MDMYSGLSQGMDDSGSLIFGSGTDISTTPVYNPTQVFGNLDAYGNMIPYGSPSTVPIFGSGSYGSGSTPGGGSFWSALSQGIANATSILGTRYAVPQLNPGQVIQTGPGGTSFLSQAQTGGSLITSSSIGGVGIGTVLLLGGGLLLVMMLGSKGKG